MRKLLVAGLNRDTTEADFLQYFSQYGNLVEKVIIKDTKTHKSMGYGFVTFDNSDSVEKVLQSRPHLIDGETLNFRRSDPSLAQSTGTKLTIFGIGPDLMAEELQEYIESRHSTSIGTVDKIDFFKEKGYGFLECSDSDFADRLSLSESSFTLKGYDMSLKGMGAKQDQGSGVIGGSSQGGARGGSQASFGGRGGSFGGRGGRGGYGY